MKKDRTSKELIEFAELNDIDSKELRCFLIQHCTTKNLEPVIWTLYSHL
jgi:hypothetical protein